VNGALPDVPPPGAGVVTEIGNVPVAFRLAAGMNVVNPLVPIKIAVGSAAPLQFTTEHGDRLLPLTVSGIDGPDNASMAAFNGDSELEVMTGSGKVEPGASAATEKGFELEFVPALLPDTVMATAAGPVARNAVSDGVITALICVELIKVVGRGEPFQLTTRPLAKPVPFTVKVKPVGLQNGVVDGASAVTVESAIGKEREFDVFALDAGVATATCAVPTDARSDAGTIAVSCAALIEVGALDVVANWVVTPFVHCTAEHGSRFVPVMISVAPALPAVALAGKVEAITGAAGVDAETEKGEVLEITPELDTCTLTVAAETISEKGTTAVSCVELTNVVASEDGSAGGGFTAHWTTELFRKFVPVTVIVTAEALQAGVELA